MITLIGLLVGLLVFVLFSPHRIRRGEVSRRLAKMYSLDTTKQLSELKPESLEYKLLAGGVQLQPASFRLLTVAAGVTAAVITWPFLPGIPALILGVIACFLPYSWLSEKVKSRGREIDRLMPVAVGRITAGLLSGGSIPDVLQRTGDSLEMEAPNPLTPELSLTVAELRSKDRQQAFRGLAARSPSNSLSNLAYLLDGYSEAGGGKYAEVLLQISQRVQQILVARNRSIAKASDALLSARLIPGVLLVVFLFLTRDPLIQGSLLALPVQVVISAGIGMMVVGYLMIRSIVSEAV
jgi:Flp pilus assembly protein TadB